MKILPPFAASAALVFAVMPFKSGYGQDPNWKRPGTEEAAAVEQANTQIDAVYKRLMSNLDAEEQKSLQEAQRSWLKWRDNEALLIARIGGAVGGSALHVDLLTAQAKLIRQRTEVLKEYSQRSGGNRVAAVEGAAATARTSPTASFVSSPKTNPAATTGSERFVIKGLRLGAGPSTVLEFLKENSFTPSSPPHHRSLAGKTSIQTISYVDSQEYRNRKTGLAEAILTLEFTPPFPGSSGVVSVVHSIQYSTKYGEGLSKEQVLADLQAKYGKPDSISPKSNDAIAPTWTVQGTNYDCNLQATIIPPANAGEPGELQLWAFDKPLYWRAEKMAKDHIDRVDAQRPKDPTRPDF